MVSMKHRKRGIEKKDYRIENVWIVFIRILRSSDWTIDIPFISLNCPS